MCSVDAPAPTIIEADKPTFVRNPFLDDLDGDVASADALRRGRSSLVIPRGDGIGFEGRNGAGSSTGINAPNGNGQGPLGNSGGGSGGSGSSPYAPGSAPKRPHTGEPDTFTRSGAGQ